MGEINIFDCEVKAWTNARISHPEIPQTAPVQLRSKPTSSGLEVEAKFYSQH